jgi:hypothetical protein
MNIKKKEYFIILAICIFIFLLKILISFQTAQLNHEAYFHLSQAKQIQNTGLPEMHELVFDASVLPLQDYVLSFFGIFFNLEIAAKILTALISAIITFVVFLIIKQIVKKKEDSNIAIISSLFSGFVVLLFSHTTNNYSSLHFNLLMFLATTYMFIKSIKNIQYLNGFILSIILFILISPLSIIFIATYVIYFIFLASERIKIRSSEIEMFIFSIIVSVWIYSILYKDLILNQGIKYFLNPIILTKGIEWNIINVVAMLGVIPVLFGSLGIYKILSKKANRKNLFIISLIFTSLILLITGIANKIFCFSVLAIGIIIASSISLKRIKETINKTKLKKAQNYVLTIILILFILTSVIPSITNAIIKTHETPTKKDVYVLKESQNKINDNELIMTKLDESYVVKFFTNKGTLFTDSVRFNTEKDKIKDVKEFYDSTLKTNAIRTLNLYEVKYVFISETTKKNMTKTELSKFDDECFKKIKSAGATMYESLCQIKSEEEINEELFETENKND